MRVVGSGIVLFKNKKLMGIFKSEIQLLLIVSILCILLIQQIYKCLQCRRELYQAMRTVIKRQIDFGACVLGGHGH